MVYLCITVVFFVSFYIINLIVFPVPGRTQQLDGGKNQEQNRTDVRIKLERPHDHKSTSVSLASLAAEFKCCICFSVILLKCVYNACTLHIVLSIEQVCPFFISVCLL